MIFTMNDDRMLMEFLSGRYLGYPEAHSIYMNYPLTFLIASLYKIAPSFDWYSFTLIAVMILCVGLMFFRCWSVVKHNRKKGFYLLAAAALILFTIGENFLALTFSTVAAVAGITTLVWYGTSKGTKSDMLISGLLAALTWCIRDELLIMVLPAAGLIWLFREFPKKKSWVKKFGTPLVVFLSVGLCMLCDSAAYSSDEWKKFNEYNMETQTEIYDYLSDYYFPNYEEYKAYYQELGLSNEQRRVLIYASFLYVQDEIPTETLDRIVEIRENYGDITDGTWKTRILNGTQYLGEHLLEGRYGVRLHLGLVGFLIVLLIFIVLKNRAALLQTSAITAGMIAIVWLMEVRGRVPERVADSLAMMVFVMMLLVWIWHLKEICGIKYMKYLVGTAVIVLGIGGVVGTCQKSVEVHQIRETNFEYESIRNYCQTHSDNFYIVSIGALNKYGINVTAGKVDNSQNNYISAGDWMAYSPIQMERLKQEGISSVAEAIMENDSIYIISEDDNYLKYPVDYLESRYGQEINVQKVDEVNSQYFVYQLDFFEN